MESSSSLLLLVGDLLHLGPHELTILHGWMVVAAGGGAAGGTLAPRRDLLAGHDIRDSSSQEASLHKQARD